MNNTIKIIHEPDSQKPFVILDKATGLPSAPLNDQDRDNAFFQASKLFPQLLQVKGKKEIEHGLLHRLDTVTSGLLIIAANQKCYDFLLKEQEEGRIKKYYLAECDIIKQEHISTTSKLAPVVPEPVEGLSFNISSYFRPYGPGRKEVRPVTQASGRAALKKTGKAMLYTTNIKVLKINKEKKTALVECTITKGYRHQVRCHLAWAGLPIINDPLYNKNKKSTEPIHFCASKIEFEYPRGDLNSYDRKDTWT